MTPHQLVLPALVAALTTSLALPCRSQAQTPADTTGSPLTAEGSFTQFWQGPDAGNSHTEVEYGGRLDVTARLDTKKLGIWPDGLFLARAVTRYGDSGNESIRTGIPLSAALIDPAPTGTVTALIELTYTHRIYLERAGDFVNVAVGKFDAYDLLPERFLGGGGLTKWMNFAQVAPPHEAMNLPTLTPLAAKATLVLKGETRAVLAVLDPSTEPTSTGLKHPFDQGVTLLGTAILPTHFFGLLGHQELRTTWSNRDRTRFERIPRLLLPPSPWAFPPVESSWTVTWTGDQYLENPVAPRTGLGAFWLLGLGDEGSNPIPFFANIGVSGSSPILGRPHDSFGMAWGYMKLSDDYRAAVEPVLMLGAEQEIELFYNCAATSWLRATAGLQVIEPFESSRDPMIVPAGRLQIVF